MNGSLQGLPEPIAARFRRAEKLRAEAKQLDSEAVAFLRGVLACPECGRTGKPYCTYRSCNCSESCHNVWHQANSRRT